MTGMLRLTVNTRWMHDGALATGGPSTNTVRHVFDKPQRRGESNEAHLARVRKDASWYVDTPSPYYRGSVVEIESVDDRGQCFPIELESMGARA